ncbi:serine hydroxymethyltransferase, partial [Candidatus Parcubacteria bacterium]
PSGIRFGTPAITTRGFKEKESGRVAELMVEAMRNKDNKRKLLGIREEIRTMCKKRPIPASFV